MLLCATVVLSSCMTGGSEEEESGGPITGIRVDPTSVTLETGEEFMPTAYVLPMETDEVEITWSSSNPEVATVNESGNITALKKGNATIKVTSVVNKEISGTCEVTVIPIQD